MGLVGKIYSVSDVELVSHDVWYDHLTLEIIDYDRVHDIYTCELITADKYDGCVVRVSGQQIRNSYDSE